MAVVLEEAAAVLGISVKDIERQALRSLIEKEPHSIRVELLSICQKLGENSWEGMHDCEFVLRLDFPAWHCTAKEKSRPRPSSIS